MFTTLVLGVIQPVLFTVSVWHPERKTRIACRWAMGVVVVVWCILAPMELALTLR